MAVGFRSFAYKFFLAGLVVSAISAIGVVASVDTFVEPVAAQDLSCDQNYDPCIRVSDTDLNCSDIRVGVRVIVPGVDPHNFDADGDGRGCESFSPAPPVRIVPHLQPDPVFCNGREATIVGTDSRDIINGTPGDDVIASLGGHDVINGGGGDDVICGGAGIDTIRSGRQ